MDMENVHCSSWVVGLQLGINAPQLVIWFLSLKSFVWALWDLLFLPFVYFFLWFFCFCVVLRASFVVVGDWCLIVYLYWFLQIKREGVLLLRGLDSRLSKDLPSDLQKLRCKVFCNNKNWYFANIHCHSNIQFFFFFLCVDIFRDQRFLSPILLVFRSHFMRWGLLQKYWNSVISWLRGWGAKGHTLPCTYGWRRMCGWGLVAFLVWAKNMMRL